MTRVAKGGFWGFTGTRQGWTEPQRKTVERLWRHFQPLALHHGDCQGADFQIHQVALRHIHEFNTSIIVHPPVNPRYRAFCSGIPDYVEVRETYPYLERDMHIVRESTYVLATPAEVEPKLHSGTWATIGIADRFNRPLVIVYPDGKIDCRRITLGKLPAL